MYEEMEMQIIRRTYYGVGDDFNADGSALFLPAADALDHGSADQHVRTRVESEIVDSLRHESFDLGVRDGWREAKAGGEF